MTETPLTPDAIEVALHDCMPGVAFDRLSATQVMRLAEDMHAALTDPRPLAPDAITAAMVKRGFKQLAQMDNDGIPLRSARAVRQVLEAALTDPPARPEGAEDMDNDMRLANAAALSGALTPEQRRALADHLAAFGYRKEA